MPWRKGNRLQLLPEQEASGRIAEVFDEAKAALGISYVPLFLQALACHPRFLEVQWCAFKPLLATREFFESAARLGAEAYTNLHLYFKIPKLGDGLTASEALTAVDQFCSLEPAALLCLSVQLHAFEAAVGADALSHPADRVARGNPPGFIDPEAAPHSLRRVFDEIRHSLDLPFIPEEQQALANWPELLVAYWQALKPAVQSIIYERAVLEIRESALKCALQIPVQVDLEYSRLLSLGVEADDIADITRCTEMLARGSAMSLLNATFAKIGLEGGNRESLEPEVTNEKVA